MSIGARIWNFVREHDLGTVYAAETGFILRRDPDSVPAPDVAFVRKGWLAEDRDRQGFAEIARPGRRSHFTPLARRQDP